MYYYTKYYETILCVMLVQALLRFCYCILFISMLLQIC